MKKQGKFRNVSEFGTSIVNAKLLMSNLNQFDLVSEERSLPDVEKAERDKWRSDFSADDKNTVIFLEAKIRNQMD